MNTPARALAACAILAAFAAGPADAAPGAAPAAVTSFGASLPLSANDLASISDRAATRQDGVLALPGSFAASMALSPTFAIDGGYRIDLSSRFLSFDRAATPILDGNASFLALADGGRYGGITYVPSSELQLRLGGSAWNGRFDSLSFDASAATGIPFAVDRSSVTSVLAGVSWNATEWASFGLDAVSVFQNNTPLAYGLAQPLGTSASTNAVEVSAHFNLGNDWVTSTHFSQGFTQLNLRGSSDNFDSQAYSITVAKHGVFGDDAVAFSLSRPAPGMIGSFSAFSAAGDLPPIMLPTAKTAARETDFQLGYVTSYWGGRLALQTNAGFQMNAQGQTGASAVSVLSRAKIKF